MGGGTILANLSLLAWALLADEVPRLTVLVSARLHLLAPVALSAALEVVVLAIAADPATIREVEAVSGRVRGLVDTLLAAGDQLLRSPLLLLVLAPLGTAGVVLLLGRSATALRVRIELLHKAIHRFRGRRSEGGDEAFRCRLQGHRLLLRGGKGRRLDSGREGLEPRVLRRDGTELHIKLVLRHGRPLNLPLVLVVGEVVIDELE